jgi:hypothetical protein
VRGDDWVATFLTYFKRERDLSLSRRCSWFDTGDAENLGRNFFGFKIVPKSDQLPFSRDLTRRIARLIGQGGFYILCRV